MDTHRLRRWTSLGFVALLTSWSGAPAQPEPSPPTILLADRIRLWEQNQVLLEGLLEQGLRLSDSDTHLGRADECRKALVVLAEAVQKTVEQPNADTDRLTELADQMTRLTLEGLVPTLSEARQQILAGSPGALQLQRIETSTVDDLRGLLTGLEVDPRFSRSSALQSAISRLRNTLPAVQPSRPAGAASPAANS